MAVSASKPKLILGGGLIGLSLAHELAKEGEKVEVLSKNRNESAGFVAAGMLAPHAEGLKNELLKLGQLSLNEIPKWVSKIESDSGMKCGYRKCGIIVPFKNSKELNAYRTVNYGEKLNRIELEKEIPGINSQWKTALLFNQDGQIDNRRQLMRALEKACVEVGVNFQEGVEVINLLEEEKQLIGVQIRNAEGEVSIIEGTEAVICGGAWSKKLLPELPIFPVKGQMLSIQGPKSALKKILFGPGTYLVPREDGLIIVGATSEKDAGFQEGLTPCGQKKLKKGLSSLLPAANYWPHMERWWGFRPCTPDEKPILGKSNINGVWLATGHHRNGVLLAAITTRLLKQCIFKEKLNDTEKELLHSFRLGRFNNNQLIY